MFTSSERSEAKRGNLDGAPSGFSGSANFSSGAALVSSGVGGVGRGSSGLAGTAALGFALGFWGWVGPRGGTTGVFTVAGPAFWTAVRGAAEGGVTG